MFKKLRIQAFIAGTLGYTLLCMSHIPAYVAGKFVNILAMCLFGIAIGVLICFVGGLMAVDIVPRKATGAGVIGRFRFLPLYCIGCVRCCFSRPSRR